MSETETYDERPRHQEAITITERTDYSFGMSNGFHLGFAAIPEEHRDLFQVGAEFVIETRGMTTLTGIQHNGAWLFHKSDQDLAREHEEFVAQVKARDERIWEQYHESWARREAALPLPLRRRLERFRANGGHGFEVDGWAYELVASELAELYQASGGEDSDEVNEYAAEHGTSGNQHSFAKALARLLDEDPRAAVDAVAALSPLTSDPDYSKSAR